MQTRRTKWHGLFGVALLGIAMAGVSSAQVVPDGSGQLFGKEKLKVKRCDGESAALYANVVLAADGSWTADTPAAFYAGTSQPGDRKGRKWNLSFSPASLALYDAVMTDWASDLCEATVAIEGIEVRSFSIKLNKRGDGIAAALKSRATGYSEFGSGSGSHSISLKGAWSLAP